MYVNERNTLSVWPQGYGGGLDALNNSRNGNVQTWTAPLSPSRDLQMFTPRGKLRRRGAPFAKSISREKVVIDPEAHGRAYSSARPRTGKLSYEDDTLYISYIGFALPICHSRASRGMVSLARQLSHLYDIPRTRSEECSECKDMLVHFTARTRAAWMFRGKCTSRRKGKICLDTL